MGRKKCRHSRNKLETIESVSIFRIDKNSTFGPTVTFQNEFEFEFERSQQLWGGHHSCQSNKPPDHLSLVNPIHHRVNHRPTHRQWGDTMHPHGTTVSYKNQAGPWRDWARGLEKLRAICDKTKYFLCSFRVNWRSVASRKEGTWLSVDSKWFWKKAKAGMCSPLSFIFGGIQIQEISYVSCLQDFAQVFFLCATWGVTYELLTPWAPGHKGGGTGLTAGGEQSTQSKSSTTTPIRGNYHLTTWVWQRPWQLGGVTISVTHRPVTTSQRGICLVHTWQLRSEENGWQILTHPWQIYEG